MPGALSAMVLKSSRNRFRRVPRVHLPVEMEGMSQPSWSLEQGMPCYVHSSEAPSVA
jgi:hypothetical protein